MEIVKFGVEEWLNVWETEAKYDIAGSSISAMTVEEIIQCGPLTTDEFFQALLHKKMDYGWIEGSPEFRCEVSKLYTTVKPSQVLQTNGATGANFIALFGLIKPGDHVISMHPTYQQLYDLPRAFGAEVSLWEIDEANAWLPHLDDLKKLIRPNTKMICINNASNPTGSLMDEAYLKELVAIAKEVGAIILCDEIFRPFTTDIKVPSLIDLYEKAIVTNSLSKTFSVPGARVGWVVASEEICEVFKKIRDYTMISSGVINDVIATYVLRNKEAVYKRNQAIVEENLKIVQAWIDKEPRVTLPLQNAVSTSLIKLDVPMETEAFCIQLLKEKGVLLVPGNRFELPGYARLGYCVDAQTLKNGLRELSAFLRQFDEIV